MNTPFIPANPNVPPLESIKANPVFDYQLYFQEPVSVAPRATTGAFVFAFPLPISFAFALSLSPLILCGISQKQFYKWAKVKLPAMPSWSFPGNGTFPCVFGW